MLKRSCYNYSRNDNNNKNYSLKKCKKVTINNEPTVLLVRLEDDPHLQTYILESNIRTDFKNFTNCSAKTIVKQNFLKDQKGPVHYNSKNDDTDLVISNGHADLRIKNFSSINNMTFDFADENVSNQQEDKLLSVPGTNNNGNVKNNTSDLNCNEEKDCDASTTVLPKSATNNRKKKKLSPTSRKKDKTVIEITKNKIEVDANKVASEGIMQKDFVVSAEKLPIEKEIVSDIEEPLSLISKLTGCQVPPNKVEILPLSSCVGNNQGSSKTTSSENTDRIICQKDNRPDVLNTGLSQSSFLNMVSSEETKNEICSKSYVQMLDASDKETRTVYDVMDYVSVVKPSWNLHILPDTNTFCICSVSRNKSGIPHISKCIELDDDFNGKVYIHEQHCTKFDGVYNSEEAVVDLINKVDAFQ